MAKNFHRPPRNKPEKLAQIASNYDQAKKHMNHWQTLGYGTIIEGSESWNPIPYRVWFWRKMPRRQSNA